jgi:hypothetical protein
MSIVIPDENVVENFAVDGSFLEACLKRRLQSMVSETNEEHDFSAFPHILKNPDVWVRDEEGHEIKSVESVIKMLHSLTDIQEVASYYGHDHDKVVLLNGALPIDWQAQIKNVMVRHLPGSLLKNGADKVFLAEMPAYGKASKGKRKLVARGVPNGAIRTNSSWENVPKKEIVKYYHNVTLKLSRGNPDEQMLLSWIPGLDLKSNVCDGLEGVFVELQEGAHYNRLRFSDRR